MTPHLDTTITAARRGVAVTHARELPSPVGPLLLTSAGGRVTGVFFGEAHAARHGVTVARFEPDAILDRTARALDGYFAGHVRTFDVPIASASGTPFQNRVWSALLEIPHGETRSYAELAARLGSPDSARAVGAANGKNPLSILVPCHRVIGASGALTGYAGGTEAKRWLLDHERAFE
ncbi:MAG: methylated-DNA--[protein]-cysteine S-methyltransferase [Sandaracinaceae bacterium]